MISKTKIFISIVVILLTIGIHMFKNHFLRNSNFKQKQLVKLLESANQENKKLISEQSTLLIKERIINEAEEKLAFVKCSEDDPKIINVYDFQKNQKSYQFVLLDLITSTAEAKTN